MTCRRCRVPSRARSSASSPFDILVTGVGGTGVVTIGALLAMAAHLEGKGCGSIDMAGLAQKGGAVYSHVKIARKARTNPRDPRRRRRRRSGARLRSRRLGQRQGARRAAPAARPASSSIRPKSIPAISPAMPISRCRRATIKGAIRRAAGDERRFLRRDGSCDERCSARRSRPISSCSASPGSAGFVPLSEAALMRAIELNGEAVDVNKRAFLWGRRAAFAPETVAAIVAPAPDPTSAPHLSQQLRGDRRAARRLPHRLSERSLRGATISPWSPRAAEVEDRRTPKQTRSSGGGGAQSLQADGGEGRI